MKQKKDRKRNVSYYTGWGIAWGAYAGGLTGLAVHAYIVIPYISSVHPQAQRLAPYTAERRYCNTNK